MTNLLVFFGIRLKINLEKRSEDSPPKNLILNRLHTIFLPVKIVCAGKKIIFNFLTRSFASSFELYYYKLNFFKEQ